MPSGTIFIDMEKERCEIVVMPETPTEIDRVRNTLVDAGFLVKEGEILGNLAVKFTEQASVEDLQELVCGNVYGVKD